MPQITKIFTSKIFLYFGIPIILATILGIFSLFYLIPRAIQDSKPNVRLSSNVYSDCTEPANISVSYRFRLIPSMPSPVQNIEFTQRIIYIFSTNISQCKSIHLFPLHNVNHSIRSIYLTKENGNSIWLRRNGEVDLKQPTTNSISYNWMNQEGSGPFIPVSDLTLAGINTNDVKRLTVTTIGEASNFLHLEFPVIGSRAFYENTREHIGQIGITTKSDSNVTQEIEILRGMDFHSALPANYRLDFSRGWIGSVLVQSEKFLITFRNRHVSRKKDVLLILIGAIIGACVSIVIERILHLPETVTLARKNGQ